MKVLTSLKLAAVTVALAFAARSHSADIPVSVADPAQPAFATPNEAARAALAASISLSRIVEYAGAVYYADDEYHYTVPVTSGDSRDVQGYRIAITRRGTVVALYHTHPQGVVDDASQYFSPADVATANGMHVVSYIGVIRSGKVIEYDYRHDKTRTAQDSAHISGDRIADGRIVGQL